MHEMLTHARNVKITNCVPENVFLMFTYNIWMCYIKERFRVTTFSTIDYKIMETIYTFFLDYNITLKKVIALYPSTVFLVAWNTWQMFKV
jgi:hypothetical protein